MIASGTFAETAITTRDPRGGNTALGGLLLLISP